MYDHVLRAQRRSVLEWLVVNALIPSVLVSFAHHVWHVQHPAQVRWSHVWSEAGFLFPSDGPKPGVVFPILEDMPTPVYPARLRRAGIEGRIILRALVNVHGRVDPSSVVVVQASEPQFVLAARQALCRAQFLPGRVGGKPVTAWATVAIDFGLDWSYQ